MKGLRKILAGVSVFPSFEFKKMGVTQPSKGGRLINYHSHKALLKSKRLSSKKISFKRCRI